MADDNSFLKVVGMGPLDLELTLALTEEDMMKFNIRNIEEIKSINDLRLILSETNAEPTDDKNKKNVTILDYIRLSSTNSTLNSLLYINKAFKKKTFIEFLALNESIYTEEESFMREVIKYVTEQNYLFIIENSIYDSPVKIKFTIKLADSKDSNQIKTFDLKMSSKKQKHESSFYETLNYDFEMTNYFLLDLNHFLELDKSGFDFNQFSEFIKILTLNNPKMLMVMNFPDIISNVSSLNLDSINTISDIVSLTDIFIFEKKEALALFNLLHELNSDENEKKDEKINLEILFLKEINKKRKGLPKIGIFFDEFKKLTIIEQQPKNNLVIFHSDFDFDVIPQSLSPIVKEDCKKLLTVHNIYLRFIFIGGFFSRLFYKRSFSTCFTAGNESVKRNLEIIRLNLDYPIDGNFYNVKIKKTGNQDKKELIEKKKKEQHFVLDCINPITSKKKEYNPLYDGNLKSFFASESIKQHLKKVGFINKRAEILQDPDTKKLGIIKNRSLIKKFEGEQSKLHKIREENKKMTLQIKNVFVGSTVNLKNINQNDLENLSKIHNFVPSYATFLPGTTNFNYTSGNSKRSASPLRNDLYAKAIAENKKDQYYPNKRKENKNKKNKNLKPINKDEYLKMLDSIENKVNNSNKNSYRIPNESENEKEKIRENADKKFEEIEKKQEKVEEKQQDKPQEKEEKVLEKLQDKQHEILQTKILEKQDTNQEKLPLENEIKKEKSLK